MSGYNVAVVGATGAVGETLFEVLEERNFPIKQIFPLASSRSAGKTVTVSGKKLEVMDTAEFDFSQVQVAFFSAGGDTSKTYVPKAVAAGCLVIDNTSAFRRDDEVPLVVPEVNPDAVDRVHESGIIANPNCSTIQMLVAINPIYKQVGIKRINVATYQSVSGGGRSAIKELASQTAALLNGKPAEPKVFPTQIAFNPIPQIDNFQDNGYTREEMKMVWETQKILDDPEILVNPTAVRVPTFFGHSEAIHLETEDEFLLEDVHAWLQAAQGVECMADESDYPTAMGQAVGQDDVWVGRIRRDISHPNGLNLWCVADNIRKGAATNAVQIAELLIEKQLLTV
jgi:aspartate-semialdehyde dehydrogenase